MTIAKNIFYTTVLGALLVSPSVFAETVIVTNASSYVNSGSNSASGGQIMEGEAVVEVFIETVVDGEVVQSVHKKETSGGGEVLIEESNEYISDDVVKTTANSQILVENVEKIISKNISNNLRFIENAKKMALQSTKIEKRGLLASIKNFFKYVFSVFA